MASGLTFSALALALFGCGRFGFTEVEVEADAALETPDATVQVDGGVEPNVFPGCTPTSLLCDDFESLGLSAWTTTTSGGSAELTVDRAFRGDSSVHVTTLAAGSTARLAHPHPNVSSGTLYTRAYWYFPSAGLSSGTSELTSAGDDSGVHHHLGIDGDSPILLVNNDSSASSITITSDTWTCIEIEVQVAATGRARLRIGNALAASLDGLNTAVAGGYEQTSFGAYFTEDSVGAIEFFIDDVIVADAPIGCL